MDSCLASKGKIKKTDSFFSAFPIGNFVFSKSRYVSIFAFFLLGNLHAASIILYGSLPSHRV